mgnify:CR=1 FL=1
MRVPLEVAGGGLALLFLASGCGPEKVGLLNPMSFLHQPIEVPCEDAFELGSTSSSVCRDGFWTVKTTTGYQCERVDLHGQTQTFQLIRETDLIKTDRACTGPEDPPNVLTLWDLMTRPVDPCVSEQIVHQFRNPACVDGQWWYEAYDVVQCEQGFKLVRNPNLDVGDPEVRFCEEGDPAPALPKDWSETPEPSIE